MRAWWARRLKRQVPAIEYYSLSPAGHCPHHEAPHTVNVLIRQWIQAKVRCGGAAAPGCCTSPVAAACQPYACSEVLVQIPGRAWLSVY